MLRLDFIPRWLVLPVFVTLCTTIPGISVAVQSPEFIGSHGSICQPANLGQAVNFQTSWSQLGVRNVNALGSGRSFFVVCPVTVTDDNTAINPSSILVHVRYDDRDGTNWVTCTAYRLDALSGGFVKTVTVADTTPGTGPLNVTLDLAGIASGSDKTFNLSAESYAVVCALVPRSGIQGVVFDHE